MDRRLLAFSLKFKCFSYFRTFHPLACLYLYAIIWMNDLMFY